MKQTATTPAIEKLNDYQNATTTRKISTKLHLNQYIQTQKK